VGSEGPTPGRAAAGALPLPEGGALPLPEGGALPLPEGGALPLPEGGRLLAGRTSRGAGRGPDAGRASGHI